MNERKAVDLLSLGIMLKQGFEIRVRDNFVLLMFLENLVRINEEIF